ncbi:hypothetical protein [Methanoculleus chikugoensis]|uniref:hypothetical protein n=1 Tax=Methanoculleus chikugoensis TaxID=118126 RepID=UPI0006D2AC8E|nr:hypothetical protein [Methanoculleus chikugoensis]
METRIAFAPIPSRHSGTAVSHPVGTSLLFGLLSRMPQEMIASGGAGRILSSPPGIIVFSSIGDPPFFSNGRPATTSPRPGSSRCGEIHRRPPHQY